MGCLSCADAFSPMMRARISGVPPAGKGTIIVIVRAGNDSARAWLTASVEAIIAVAIVMVFLPVMCLISGSIVIVEIEQQTPLLRGSERERAAMALSG